MLELSIAEQKLLDFAREEFGDFLTSFLLAGLGEEVVGQRRHFAITYPDSGGGTLERRVQVITYEPVSGEAYLPRGQDPLVLLTLLKLLADEPASRYELFYNRGDVLNLLGWEDNIEAQNKIDEAVDRYSLMVFKWEMNGAELAKSNLLRHVATECLVSEYRIINEEEGHSQQARHMSNHIVFQPDFIEHLKRRSLFGIDWNKVLSLKLSRSS